jgi:hypothetical protein
MSRSRYYYRLPSWLSLLLVAVLSLLPVIDAERLFESNSLNSCMKNSSFQADLFRVVFTPDNGSLTFNINGVSQTTAQVLLDFQVIGYGYSITRKVIDPCSPSNPELKGVCPLPAAPIALPGNAQLPKGAVGQIPSRWCSRKKYQAPTY